MNAQIQNAIGCLVVVLCFASSALAQSTFDLEPPITASPSQIARSPDPATLPSFRFATAEFIGEGQIQIATKTAVQQMKAPMPTRLPPPELDPRGIRYTEETEREYTVYRKFIEKDENGDEVEVSKPEKRTRKGTVTRYRDRNEEEQVEFEKRIAELKAKQEAGEIPTPAVPARVEEEYSANLTRSVVDDDGNEIRVRVCEPRTRTVVVYRGESRTIESIDTSSYAVKDLECFGSDGSELDEETIAKRLSERKPVILIPNKNSITPFFESLLHPEAIFIVTPH